MSYPPPPPGQQPMPPQDHPRATLSLVLGILGILVCGIIAPFAWSIGKRTLAEIDESGGRLGGRGMAQVGYVLGLVGTILLVIGVLVIVVLVVAGVIGASQS
jgi:uncharacterized membrane protein YjgN (DUF898 family)